MAKPQPMLQHRCYNLAQRAEAAAVCRCSCRLCHPCSSPNLPCLQTVLKSAAPPEGYKDGDSLADKLMTAMVMDNMLDDSPLNRSGGGIGGFSGEAPQGVGTMDLTDSMQTLSFPGQEVSGAAPDIDVDPTAENPLAGIAQDYFEEPREMNVKNVNPRHATKE